MCSSDLAGVAAVGTGGGKFAQLVADHILGNINRYMLASVMHSKGAVSYTHLGCLNFAFSTFGESGCFDGQLLGHLTAAQELHTLSLIHI